MFGDNPIRGLEKGDGSTLLIQSIFKTFQGEGPFAGYPSIFIRLGGCNLACDFCDTEFESYDEMQLQEVLSKTDELSGKKANDFTHKLAVITGGEPFRQNIVPLCDRLINNGYTVQIETNGTLYRELNKDVHIICSPKNTGKGYRKIRDDLLKRLDAIKFIVSATHELYKDVAQVGQSDYDTPVYVQPMDEYSVEKNNHNMKHATILAEKYGYRLGIQMHKILGIE